MCLAPPGPLTLHASTARLPDGEGADTYTCALVHVGRTGQPLMIELPIKRIYQLSATPTFLAFTDSQTH
jgi:hypothetical protein